MWRHVFLVVVAVSGCARAMAVEGDAGPGATPGADAPGGGEPAAADAPDQVPATDAPQGVAPARLMLTEVVLAPSTGELVELANPGPEPIDLSTFYLSDAGTYFRLPAAGVTLDSGDFVVRFPAGAMIPPNGVITVALDTAASFASVYGTAPTYSVADGSMTSIATSGVPSLTNSGELVVLFQWDGASDLVRDVDIMIAGLPTAANGLVDKSGAQVDGPDPDGATSAYAPDARTLAPQPSAPVAGRSTKRTAPETGHELQTGAGNGLDGDDETSEDTATTWDTTFTTPTPGVVPTALLP